VSKQSITEMVAGLAATVDSTTVVVWEPDEFRRTADSADTPIRIILPSTEGDVHTFGPMGTGRLSRMEWVIKDMLLYAPVEEGLGWYDVAYDLDNYIDSYATALTAANHNLTTGFCTIPAEVESVTFQTGVHTFSARSYYGVLATLRIYEFIA